MSDLLLPQEEIEAITGSKATKKQKEFLDQAGIPCVISNDNKVQIVRAWIERAPFEKVDQEKIELPSIPGREPSMQGFGT